MQTTALATVRFPSHDGRVHKDDVLATMVAQQIKPQITGSCTITAGVHVEDQPGADQCHRGDGAKAGSANQRVAGGPSSDWQWTTILQ